MGTSIHSPHPLPRPAGPLQLLTHSRGPRPTCQTSPLPYYLFSVPHGLLLPNEHPDVGRMFYVIISLGSPLIAKPSTPREPDCISQSTTSSALRTAPARRQSVLSTHGLDGWMHECSHASKSRSESCIHTPLRCSCTCDVLPRRLEGGMPSHDHWAKLRKLQVYPSSLGNSAKTLRHILEGKNTEQSKTDTLEDHQCLNMLLNY